MKTKRLKLSAASSFLLKLSIALFMAGCEEETNQSDSNLQLFGTWKFVLFEENDGSTVNVLPNNCDDCYILTFKNDSTIEGKTVLNTLGKDFTLSGNQLSFPNGVLATEILEEGMPLQFTNALIKVQSFKVEESKLKLFYSANDFLLFDPKSKSP